jgi:hypothetical protein
MSSRYSHYLYSGISTELKTAKYEQGDQHVDARRDLLGSGIGKFNEATNLVRVRILTATSEDDYCSLQARRLSPP